MPVDVHYEIGQALQFYIMGSLKAFNHLMELYPLFLKVVFLDLNQSYLSCLLGLYLFIIGLFLDENFDEFFQLTNKSLINLHIIMVFNLIRWSSTVIYLIFAVLLVLLFLFELHIPILQLLIILPQGGLKLFQIRNCIFLISHQFFIWSIIYDLIRVSLSLNALRKVWDVFVLFFFCCFDFHFLLHLCYVFLYHTQRSLKLMDFLQKRLLFFFNYHHFLLNQLQIIYIYLLRLPNPALESGCRPRLFLCSLHML